MMNAASAASLSMQRIRENLKEINVDKLISQVINSSRGAEAELKLSLSQLSEMFGQITPSNVASPGMHPFSFRAFRKELQSSGYKVGFEQLGPGREWFFVISWRDALSSSL